MRRIFCTIVLLGIATFLKAQVISSVQDGPWNSTATWGGTIPTAANSTSIEIQHNVNIPSGYTAIADQITVTETSTLTIDAGGALNLQNSGGTDLILQEDLDAGIGANLIVDGDFVNNSQNPFSFGIVFSTAIFNSGSRYIHAINGGSLPLINTTWNSNSTCELTGITNAAPSGLNQIFGNLTYNSPGTNTNILFDLTTTTINGNLTLSNTNAPTNRVFLASGGTITIEGDFIVSGAARFTVSSSGTATLNVGGNYANSSPNTSTLTLNGNTTLNVSGDFTHTAGTLQGNTTSSIHFTNTTAHAFTGGGSFSNVNVFVDAGSTLNLDASNAFTFRNLTINGTLNATSGNNNVNNTFANNGTFNNDGGTITFGGAANTIGGTSTTNFQNVTISASGTLTAPATLNVGGNFTNSGTYIASTTLNVGGDFSNSGTFTHSDGRVVFNGSGTQSISGTATFYDVTANNNVSVEGAIGLANYLTLGGSVTFDADGSGAGNFTLLSTSSRTGGILEIPDNSTVSGNLNFQRYLVGTNDYKFMCFPVHDGNPANGVTISELQPSGGFGFPISGNFTGRNLSNSPSFFRYDEPTVGHKDVGWEQFPVSTNTERVSSLEGYIVFLWSSRTPTGTTNIRGQINQQDVSLNVPYSDPGGDPITENGWNLVANPYPCAIQWDNNISAWSKTDINDNIQIWDGNGYVTIQAGTGGTIAPGQAFWVKAESAAAELTVSEAAKIEDGTASFLRTSSIIENQIIVSLSDDVNTDKAYIQFNDESTDDYDKIIDGVKLSNAIFNLSSFVKEDQYLVVNNLPIMECQKSIGLNIDNINPGDYTLNFSNLQYLDFDAEISLVDHYLSQEVEIVEGFEYNFSVDSDQASFGNARFEIVVKQANLSKPEITFQDNILVSNVETENQWYKDGQLIVDATNKTLSVNETGIYHVKSSHLGCESASEDLIAYVSEDDKDFEGCSNEVVLSLESLAQGQYELTLINYQVDDSLVSTNFVDEYLGSEMSVDDVVNYGLTIDENQGSFVNRFKINFANEFEPEVVVEAHRLVSNFKSGNQWFKDDVLIEGASGDTYQVTETGEYHVKVTRNGCAKSSQKVAVEVAVTGLEDELAEMQLYPNPGSTYVTLKVPENLKDDKITVECYDKLGRRVFVKEFQPFNSEEISIDIRNLESGFYNILVRTNDISLNHKFLKN